MRQLSSFVVILSFCLSTLSPIYAKGFSSFKAQKEAKKNNKSKCPLVLNLPSGWERIDDPSQLPEKVKVLFVGKGKGQFTPSINLACEESKVSVEEYTELAKKYHESQPDTVCNPIGKLETKCGSALLLQIDKNTAWGPLRFLQASIILDGNAYVITATATLEEYLALYPFFYQAIQSFEGIR